MFCALSIFQINRFHLMTEIVYFVYSHQASSIFSFWFLSCYTNRFEKLFILNWLWQIYNGFKFVYCPLCHLFLFLVNCLNCGLECHYFPHILIFSFFRTEDICAFCEGFCICGFYYFELLHFYHALLLFPIINLLNSNNYLSRK